MGCYEHATAAAVKCNVVAVQKSLTVLSTINFWGHLNPYSGCTKNESYLDYIIVGGGTSGCVLANRLSENPHVNVMLIEAGKNFQLDTTLASMLLYTKGSRMDWNYTDEHSPKKTNQQNKYFSLAGKVLGGTSSVDVMLYSQGYDSEYNYWANLTEEPAWKFENVQRLFKKVERFNDDEIAHSSDKVYHGFSGKVSLTKSKGHAIDKYLNVFKEAGYDTVLDINNKTRTGFRGAVFYIDGKRQNSAYTYLLSIRNRPNLIVMKETYAMKVLFDKTRAIGVEAMNTRTKTTFTFHSKREIIIAAGAYSTPKILQLSGIGPKKMLESFGIKTISDLPVGNNYHTHVAVPVVFAGEQTSKQYILENFCPKQFPAYTMEGFVALDKLKINPDYRAVTFIMPYTPAVIMLQYSSAFCGFDNNVTDYWYQKTNNRDALFTYLDALNPKSRGFVKIRSTDPFAPPIVEGNYLSKKIDVDNMIKYLKNFLKLTNTNFFKKVGGFFVDPMKEKCGVYELESDEYWKCYIENLMIPRPHQCGTAAMGSVVDGRLRVYGTENLRVVDASIMPTIISGSTTIPTMMIAENAAEMIQRDNLQN